MSAAELLLDPELINKSGLEDSCKTLGHRSKVLSVEPEERPEEIDVAILNVLVTVPEGFKAPMQS